ncbi:MAG: hypothetical protein MAG431_01855 [Chloroflexi bacterium]|nr:hypothetical protein [Chloroflexota bacterium]
MPQYEFVCLDCKKPFEVFMSYTEYGEKEAQCPQCDGLEVQRIIRPIRVARSEESRLEDLADPSMLAGIEDDPKALGNMMRKMSNELGEDLGPEFDEVIDRLEKGQSPEDIEKDLPDLGLGDDDLGGM